MLRNSSNSSPVMRNVGNPLHRQVFLVLRDRIMSRRYLVGEMLPSEEEMRKLFKVSRTTLRYALSELEQAGFVTKKHGIGTFVAHQGNTEHVHASISEMIFQTEKIGKSTKVSVVDLAEQRAPTHVQEVFGSADDDHFTYALRLRRLNSGKTILCVHSYVPVELGRNITRAGLAKASLSSLLADSGHPIASATQDVTAILAEPAVAGLLELEIGAPLLQMDRILRGADGRPICYVEIIANPMFFKLHMELDELTGKA